MQRLASLACLIALLFGIRASCDGWKNTAEARMACCADENCPMHRSAASRNKASTHITQADADQCCAASEQPTSTASATAFVPLAVLTLVADSIPTPRPCIRPITEPFSPAGAPPNVPKHVLLSVFLV